MKKTIRCAAILIALCLSLGAQAQHLKRRPFLGVQIAPVSDSLAVIYGLENAEGGQVIAVIPNSTAAALKLQPQDVIVSIDKEAIQTANDVVTKARAFTTGAPITVGVIRNKKRLTLKGKVKEMPKEEDSAADVLYDEVRTNHGYARLIAKKPKGSGTYPTVFFLQGYGCSAIDNLPPHDPQRKLIDGLVAKGYAVFRMDKPGSGDSQGSAACSEIGYTEELAAFAAGLKKLKSYDFVDSANVFLFGHSLGGNTAPVIAADAKVKGIIGYGLAGKPWYEYMLDVFREQRTAMGVDPVKIDADMRMLGPLTYELLINRKSTEDLAQDPTYKTFLEESFDYDGRGHLFGRHYRFMQEIQEMPYHQSWREAATNVLVIYGEADLPSISPHNSELLVTALNIMRPGSATYKLLPGTDHGFIKVGSQQDLLRLRQNGDFEAYDRQHFNPELVEMIDSWMRQIMQNQ